MGALLTQCVSGSQSYLNAYEKVLVRQSWLVLNRDHAEFKAKILQMPLPRVAKQTSSNAINVGLAQSIFALDKRFKARMEVHLNRTCEFLDIIVTDLKVMGGLGTRTETVPLARTLT